MTIATEAPAARSTWTAAAVVAGAIHAVAVAIWLLPASVHIVRWPAGGPERVALLAPQSRVVFLVVAAIALSGLAAGWGWRSGRLGALAPRVAPLWLLWLWTVPYWPWLADRVPLLLVLAGPVRWGIAALALFAASGIGPRLRRRLARPRVLPRRWTACAVSLAVYLLFGALSARAIGPGGDEPHYLIIAHSLLADGDLKIENNHQQRDYRSFYGGELRPDYMTRGQNGEIYSIHAPGLPLLLLPAYAVAGYAGALVVLCLFAALTALAVFDLAEGIAGRGAAWMTWAGVCLTVPFVPHSWLLFPEIPGALVVAWAALWLWQPASHAPRTWVWRGAALALLPWLHTKFIVFLALFGVALLVRLRRQPRAAFALMAPMALSTAAWLWSFYVLYGTIDPEAPYGDYPQIYVLLRNIPRGLLGLLFDQKFGLLFYSPIYLATVAGCWLMVRRRETRFLALALLAATAVHVGSTTRLYMWWGGSSAPARFLVPILPCLAPMIAVAARAAAGRTARALLWTWLAISVGVAIVGVASPERLLLFSAPHGRARVLEQLEGASPLALSFPTFTAEDWVTPLVQLVPWLIAAGAAAGAMAWLARVRPAVSPVWLGVAGSILLVTGAGVGTATPVAEVREETARRGVLDLIWRFNGERQRAFDYADLRKVNPRELVQASAVLLPGRTPTQQLALPSGSYEARVWFDGSRSREGEIVVASADGAQFGRAGGTLSNPAVVPFSLPVPLRRLLLTVGGQSVAAGVARTEILPRTVVPMSARARGRIRAVEPIANRSDGYLIYTGESAFPEGGVFWTRGTERASLLVAPGAASAIALTLHLGPLAGEVRLWLAGEERAVSVGANATERVEVPLPAGVALVPLAVEAPAWFRPSDVNAASADTRRLGVQVRVDLQ